MAHTAAVSRETITIRRMLGRTSDGSTWEKRDYWHATGIRERYTASVAPALCGSRPGRYSTGWSEPEDRPVTCPECLRKLKGRP